jgi:pilus assembly protein CpaB
MGTRRLGFALVAALIISIVITSAFYMNMKSHQPSSQTKHVIAASSALQQGTPLTAENVTEVDWPLNIPMQGLIEKKEDAIGRVLIYGVDAKEPLLKHDLAAGGSYGLSAKIPDGMRATSVKTNEVSDVAGFIFPGSHVDILVTLRGENSNFVTRTVLQNVQVLATGTKTEPDPNGKPENVSVVTLLATPEESAKLALAQNQASQSQGAIHFVLRNGGDTATPNTPTVDMTELAGTPRKVAPPEVRRKRPVVAKEAPAPSVSVETISGGKASVTTFAAGQQ